MTDEAKGREISIQEIIDDFDVQLVRRGSDGKETLDMPLQDVISLVAGVTAEKVAARMKQAAKPPLIVKPH